MALLEARGGASARAEMATAIRRRRLDALGVVVGRRGALAVLAPFRRPARDSSAGAELACRSILLASREVSNLRGERDDEEEDGS